MEDIMSKFDEYYKARTEITNIIKQDLLGPVTEDEKITGELPVNYYMVGKLYPQDAIKYDNPDIVQSMSEYKENDMEKVISPKHLMKLHYVIPQIHLQWGYPFQ